MGAKIFVKKVHVYDRVSLDDEFSSINVEDDIESNGLPAVAFQAAARHGILSTKTGRSRVTSGKDGRKIRPTRGKS